MRRSYPDSLLLFLLMRTPPTDMYTLPYTTLFRSNNNRAICSYGTCLENGIGIEKNEEEAWKYYEKAEKAGKGLNPDRKSTRLNSSHVSISYAVFCLKKKIKNRLTIISRPHYKCMD